MIDRAIGILMERHKLTDDQAFTVLTRTSQNRNTKLRDVADELVTTGLLPDATSTAGGLSSGLRARPRQNP